MSVPVPECPNCYVPVSVCGCPEHNRRKLSRYPPRYCEMCDHWLSAKQAVCPDCGMETQPAMRPAPPDAEETR